MSNVKRLLIKNACYHLITRGNQKREVFKCREDHLFYLSLLKKFKRKHNFRAYAYCLMPNHVHLLGEMDDHLLLSSFMHDLNRAYTLYFNNKYEEVGHLWQGRFKSMIITKDNYLIECINYIELNPLKAGLVKQLSEYPWNSYNARVLGKDDGILNQLFLL
ncbi:MAG: transposase [Candidatus Omnitrophica bacterium]|nr:transposase [Candidatus Omnitrophota bacterium]MDD5592088.1 transposase [Candidatus Omnitrophota bacterium]